MLPVLVPVPHLDSHVVTSSQYEAARRMYSDASNVVGMCLESSDLLVCVVIEASELEVITASYEPILPRDEADASHWNLCHLKGLDQSTSLIIPDIDTSSVKTCQEPRFGRVKVD